MTSNPPHEEELFAEAIKRRPGAERKGFLDQACAKNQALRQRLDVLLSVHESAAPEMDPVFAADGGASCKPLADEEAVGTLIGPYKILEKLGEGGFGIVYVAEQREAVKRRVALKVIKLGMDTRQVIARFEAERQALAIMDHPNIAKVLDAGATQEGRPYFVMELVRGIKLTDYCDQNKLTTRERLELFTRVCQAIQHAHQKGIIHRDIKPSNILVTLHDGVPVPKVIDFGIAKATEGRLTELTVYTDLRQFLGTPAYTSPEQAEMSGLDIDTRSDIYSLGVLLYELLTGRTPFDGKELVASGLEAMRRTIRETDPLRPSTRLNALAVDELTTAAQRRGVDPPKLMSLLSGDLDWIVMKCLEKDRARRYETANGLVLDIQRHLKSEPILARPPSELYRFRKLVRRHKLVFASVATIATALILGVIGTTLGLMRAERQRKAAEASRILAEQRFLSARRFVEDVFQKVAPQFSRLVGASKAKETLALTSVAFLESLGNGSGSDETFQSELGKLYAQVASALGDPYGANSAGDYDTALRFANQSLAIFEGLQRKQPQDMVRLRSLAHAEDFFGTILRELGRYDEALIHHRRNVEILEGLQKRDPDDAALKQDIIFSTFRIGHDLRSKGLTREALDTYYLPKAKELFDRPPKTPEEWIQLQLIFVAHAVVGDSYLELHQFADALPHYEEGLRLKQKLIEQMPNDARHARDWSELHCGIGTALVGLSRFEEGDKYLQEGIGLAKDLVAKDPGNESSQWQFIESLRARADGCATRARKADISHTQQARLWNQTIHLLTQCQETLASPELQRAKSHLSSEAKDIDKQLEEARDALKKLNATAGAANSVPPAPE